MENPSMIGNNVYMFVVGACLVICPPLIALKVNRGWKANFSAKIPIEI